MKLKNTSNKLINIGETAILPDEVAEVSGFDNNPAVDALEEAGHLCIIDPPAQKGTKTDQTQEQGEEKKPLSRLNKDELLEECRKLGIETTEADTRDTLVKKIKEKTAE